MSLNNGQAMNRQISPITDEEQFFSFLFALIIDEDEERRETRDERILFLVDRYFFVHLKKN